MGEGLTERKPKERKGRREMRGGGGKRCGDGVELPETSFIMRLGCTAHAFLTARSHRRRPGCYDNPSVVCLETFEDRTVPAQLW